MWTCLLGFGGADLPQDDAQVSELIEVKPNGLSTELDQWYQKGYYTRLLWAGLARKSAG